jgi:addiction module HigA family antidote
MSGLRNWLRAKPWQIYPLWRSGWRYHTLYRTLRRGSWNPQAGRWMIGGEPRGVLASLWGAVAFPHVHDEWTEEEWAGGPIAEFNRRVERGEFDPDWTVPPGETLLELMAERDMSDTELARKMLVDVVAVHRLISGRAPLTATIALSLEEVFDVPFDFWMNLERNHREWLDRHFPGMIADYANPQIANLAAENGIDVTRCEFCSGPLDKDHPWVRGQDGACAHETCLAGETA